MRYTDYLRRYLANVRARAHPAHVAQIETAIGRYVVDGHEFANEESEMLGDGRYPPFVVFDVLAQRNLPERYTSRARAEWVAAKLNRGTP